MKKPMEHPIGCEELGCVTGYNAISWEYEQVGGPFRI